LKKDGGDNPALAILLGNKREMLKYALRNGIEIKNAHTPPSWPHYPHCWLWDGAFQAIVYASFGLPEEGEEEIRAIFDGQKENGFIPNMRFLGKARIFDPERYSFSEPSFGSNYTQPPVLAEAVLEVYQSYETLGRKEEGLTFLKEIYPKLEKFYSYFKENRRKESNLIAVLHPHETGRDSDPTFDFFKIRLSPKVKNYTALSFQKIINLLNTALDYVSALSLNYRLKKKHWVEEAAFSIFWVYDVMFNCIYVENLRAMAEIAKILDKSPEEFLKEAHAVEHDILEKMWDSKEKKFFALKDGKKIPVVSVSNLFPLILDNISEEQLIEILKLIEDPDWFYTPYPLPSVPVNSPYFDPDYKEKRLWRGPVWININWYVVRGLIKQGKRLAKNNPILSQHCFNLAKEIIDKTSSLLKNSGCREFYNPFTGEGYRVENFGWSTLGYVMEKLF
jgi:glycogen debranching enzyme